MHPVLDEYHQDTRIDLDLGDNHLLHYVGWHPDRDINPQYADMPDIDRCGASVFHLNQFGKPCHGVIYFDTPEVNRVFPGGHVWQVTSWDPLTLMPSLLCRFVNRKTGAQCNDHGFIQCGRWVRCS